MPSESLSDLCLALATLGTLFVTITLGSAALVVQGHGEAKSAVRFAANDVAVQAQLMLARLPPELRALMKVGVFDENNVATLVRAWAAPGAADPLDSGADEAAQSFRGALAAIRLSHEANGDEISRQHGVHSAARALYARETLNWEAEWLPLVQLVETARSLRTILRPFDQAASRLRSDSKWITLVAMLLVVELAVAAAAGVSTIGIGEIRAVNAVVAAALVVLNGIMLVFGSRRVSQLVRILTS